MDFDETQIRELQHSCSKRWKAIFKVLIPLSLSFLLDTLTVLLSLIYAGHLPVQNGLAVVGLSQTFCIMVIICFIMGVAASADTLITQEYGAGNFDMCANYFNKMIISTGFLIALFLPIVLFSGKLLTLIGVEHQLAYQSQDFLYPYYVAQIVYLENQNIKIMYRSQQLAWPSFVGSALTVIIFIISMELFINLVSSELWIIPASFMIANSAQFLFLLILALGCDVHAPGTLRCIKSSDLKNWYIFGCIAMITLAIEIIESYNGQIMNLIIATINSTTLAAQNVLYSITVNLYFFIAFGVSTTVAIFVGNFIGMQEVNLARKVAWELGIVFFFFSVLLVTTFAFIPQTIINLFTYDQTIIDEAMKGYYYMLMLIPLETANWLIIGILKGIGKMQWIPLQQVIIYYLIYQPLCYMLVKVYNYGFQLYWVVYLAVSVSMITINFSYLRCLSLEKIAKDIEERQNRQKEQEMRDDQDVAEKLLEGEVEV